MSDRRIKVLLVEDDPADADILSAMLSEGNGSTFDPDNHHQSLSFLPAHHQLSLHAHLLF